MKRTIITVYYDFYDYDFDEFMIILYETLLHHITFSKYCLAFPQKINLFLQAGIPFVH